MSGYENFANVYDALTENVDYKQRSAYYCALLRQYGVSDGLLLDLATIGLGLAFVAEYCLTDHEKLFPITLAEEMPSRKVVLATAGNASITQAAREFVQLFEQDE